MTLVFKVGCCMVVDTEKHQHNRSFRISFLIVLRMSIPIDKLYYLVQCYSIQHICLLELRHIYIFHPSRIVHFLLLASKPPWLQIVPKMLTSARFFVKLTWQDYNIKHPSSHVPMFLSINNKMTWYSTCRT